MDTVVKVTGLSKKYGKRLAVNNIDFEIKKGDVFGLLGPNGSGKTTTLSVILTLLSATAGKIELFGSTDLSAQLKKIGVLLESASYYPELSAYDNLLVTAKIKDVDKARIDEVLAKVGLAESRNQKVRTFSLGMKQRIALAAALLRDPELIIFDEPTNGLDPLGIAEMREIIKQLAADGKTILVASHLLNEMEKVCTQIAILKNGVIIDRGDLKTIMSGFPTLEEYFLAKTK